MIACIPGNGKDRSDLRTRVVREARGEFMFAGLDCARVKKKRHCKHEFTNADSAIGRVFAMVGGSALKCAAIHDILISF